jgi:hypothetical protein
MNTYELLLFLHVACVILWLGSGTTLALVAVYGRTRPDRAVLLERLDDIGRWLGPRVFGPASLGALGFGLALVERGSWTFHPLWIRLGLAAFALSFLINAGVRAPLMRRLGTSTEAERGRLGRLLGNVGWVDLTVLYLTVADMLAKPTTADTGTLAAGGAILAAVVAVAAASALRLRTPREMRA